MNCQAFEREIGDYIDGALAADTAAGLESHAAGCEACRALMADFRAIRGAARQLEPHVPPPHVWSAVSQAVEARRRGHGFLTAAFGWQPLAAGAMVLALGTGLGWVGTRLAPLAGREPVRIQASADTVRDAEAEYVAAITSLEQIAQEGRTTLDASTADVMQANLTVLDQAIGESRAALTTEPESTLAIESLFEALRSKVALLQDMIALINEMRKGNQEGAARLLSDINQPGSVAP